MKNILLRSGIFFIVMILFFISWHVCVNSEKHTYQVFKGAQMLNFELVSFTNPRLLKIFNSYPFLYDIDFEVAQEITQDWATRKDSALIIAYLGNAPIGYIRGMSFDSSASIIVESCKNAGLEVENYYYISDIFVDEAYRHQGLARNLFERLENYAFSLGYLYGVLDFQRHVIDDPLRQADYKDLDFSKVGYELFANTKIFIDTQVDNESGGIDVVKSEQILELWCKKLK